MPAAIDSYTWVAINPRKDRKILLRSTHFPDMAEIDLDTPNPAKAGTWSDYPHGVAVMLERAGHRLSGADILIRARFRSARVLAISRNLKYLQDLRCSGYPASRSTAKTWQRYVREPKTSLSVCGAG